MNAQDYTSPEALRIATLAAIDSDILPRAAKGTAPQQADLARRIKWLAEQPISFWGHRIAHYGGAQGNGRSMLLDLPEVMNFLRSAPA